MYLKMHRQQPLYLNTRPSFLPHEVIWFAESSSNYNWVNETCFVFQEQICPVPFYKCVTSTVVSCWILCQDIEESEIVFVWEEVEVKVWENRDFPRLFAFYRLEKYGSSMRKNPCWRRSSQIYHFDFMQYREWRRQCSQHPPWELIGWFWCDVKPQLL